MTIDISVVVPFLNEERYIRLCVESLLACDYPADRVEYLFIDNGSTDKGVEILAEYPQVTVLSENEGAVYTARNTAIRHASGKVIAFTDADCEVSKEWLSSIHEAILGDGAVIAMGPVSFAGPGSAFLDILETYRNDHIQWVIENQIWNHIYGYTNNMAVRANVFAELGPMVELPIPGDTEIIHRCLKNIPGAKIAFCPDMHIDHLELVNAGVLFKKLIHYGEFDIHRPRVDYDPPHHRRFSGAEAYTVRKNKFSFRERILFEFALWSSNACFWYGKWRCRVRRGWLRLKGSPA